MSGKKEESKGAINHLHPLTDEEMSKIKAANDGDSRGTAVCYTKGEGASSRRLPPPGSAADTLALYSAASDAVAGTIKKFGDAGVGGADAGKLALQLFGLTVGRGIYMGD